jgi:hypothetical protein
MLRIACGLAVALLLTVGSARGQEPVVLVRRLVDARYFDSPTFAALLAAMDQDLRRVSTLRAGGSLSQLIADEYGFGRTNAPAAYDVVEARIRALNNIDDPTKIPANRPLLIPDIPPMALQRPNRRNSANDIPKLSEIGLKQETITGSAYDAALGAFTKRPRISAATRPAAKFVEQYRWVPLTQARGLVMQTTEIAPVTTANVRWTVKFGNEGVATGDVSPFSVAESDRLKTLLSAAKKQMPILIILDDSWPSDEEFRRSRDFFLSALPTVRNTNKWKLGAPRFSAAFKAAKGTSYPKVRGSFEPLPLHSHDIVRSLSPLKALEPADGRVQVIFVPMFRAQTYADELLTELVHFDQLVHAPGSRLVDGVATDQIALKRKFAEDIVKSISDKIQDDLLFSDQSLIEAVLWFGAVYSRESRRPVFFSFSWITKEEDLHVEMPQALYGVPVVAAGNEGAVDWHAGSCETTSSHTAYKFRRQLVIRSKWPADVVGVMNVAPDGGPDCDSSLLEVSPGIGALAYSGRVSGKTCGTSFAAPRVAWFLAAREALRPQLQSPDDVTNWQIALRDEIASMRTQTACAFNKIRFDPVQFLSKP